MIGRIQLKVKIIIIQLYLFALSSRVMGQTLSEPVTEKQSSTCQDSRYLVGSSCMQGWRVSMDDSHTQILSLPDDPGTAFFAVYDGHGGLFDKLLMLTLFS